MPGIKKNRLPNAYYSYTSLWFILVTSIAEFTFTFVTTCIIYFASNIKSVVCIDYPDFPSNTISD